VPFAVFYLKEKITLNYVFAALCMGGAVFFIFRDKIATKPPEPARVEVNESAR
jgi:drug/metabolite transporter (DMT)-like permease